MRSLPSGEATHDAPQRMSAGEANLGAEPSHIKQKTLKRWHKQTEGNKQNEDDSFTHTNL